MPGRTCALTPIALALLWLCGAADIGRCQVAGPLPGPDLESSSYGATNSGHVPPPPVEAPPLPWADSGPFMNGPVGEPLYSDEPLLPATASCCDLFYDLGGAARGYYLNDQRIEFTGQEATFAVEGVLDGVVRQQVGAMDCGVVGELFFNQPYDRNVLVDTPQRQSFASNFDIDIVQIS
jgi:hypothetical protein